MLPPNIELHMIESEDGISVDVQKIIDAIDERTLLVPISHVLFRSAYILDVKPIIEKAHFAAPSSWPAECRESPERMNLIASRAIGKTV